MSEYDVVIVGSGINSLVCAAELTAKSRKVLVLERAQVAGGCIQTDEATAPGFHHDLFSMSYTLFVTAPSFKALEPKLAEHGVRFVSAGIPTGVVLPDNRSLLLRQTRAENIAAFDAVAAGDGAAFAEAMDYVAANAPLIFGILGQEPRSLSTAKLLGRSIIQRKLGGMAVFGADALSPMRNWLDQSFRSDLSRALIAPWILHAGIGPESSLSSMMAKVMMFTIELVGVPIVEGGGRRLVEAFVRLIEAGGGAVLTGQDVERVIVDRGRARGVVTSAGEQYKARRAVVCNVTPTQLYGRLLDASLVPSAQRSAASRFHYGRASMQIHIALKEPPLWVDPELGKVGLLHVTGGLDAVSQAINEAERGLLPVAGTIALGQPVPADPSRCPQGQSLLWVQLLELPRHVKGDAAGVIAVPVDGRWNDTLSRLYSERVLARLRTHILNLDSAMVGLRVLGPHDLEARNINLVGGDPYSGAASIDQFHLFRPTGGNRNHETCVRGLYHIGASTHPGHGLGGVSGHLVAQAVG